MGPGRVLSSAIKAVTGESVLSCGTCGTRVQQMNEWGWLGCLKERQTIITWLQEAASLRGHQVDDTKAWQLLRAAWREARNKNKDKTEGQ